MVNALFPRGLLQAGSWHRRRGPGAYTGGASEVTRILDRLQQGEAKAAKELLPLVYDELRKLAAQRMAR
jgi:hypothetical protein